MGASPFRTYFRCAGIRASLVWLLILSLAPLATAQLSPVTKPTTSTGPRAIGLLQIAKNGHATLIPIVIMINGNFYDAGVYLADPRPMALEPGTVYEGERGGESLGLFTIGGAQQVDGNWYGIGEWRTTEQIAKASQPVVKQKPTNRDEDDRPPVLRRPGSSKTPAPGSSTPSSPPQTSAPSKPADTGTPPSAQSAPQNTASTSSASNEDDTGRPILRRGKPASQAPAAVPPDLIAGVHPPKAANPEAKKTGPDTPALQLVPAISDAHGPEPRSYKFSFKPGEEEEFQKKMQALAESAITKYEKARTASFRSVELESPSFHSFDLDLSNEPVFVFTAPAKVMLGGKSQRGASVTRRVAAAGPLNSEVAFVCVVGKIGVYGDLRQLYASVTDSRHMDEIPRLELTDAADVDGNGRGDLIFRAVSDSGNSWVIYRIGPDKLIKIFDSSGAEN